MATTTIEKLESVTTKKVIVKAPKAKVELTPLQVKARMEMAALPVEFNPDSKDHRNSFAYFLVNNRWPEGTRFKSEWPHTNAIDTVKAKLVSYAVRREVAAIEATNETVQSLSK